MRVSFYSEEVYEVMRVTPKNTPKSVTPKSVTPEIQKQQYNTNKQNTGNNNWKHFFHDKMNEQILLVIIFTLIVGLSIAAVCILAKPKVKPFKEQLEGDPIPKEELVKLLK
jgi:hypothetical protein